MARLTTPKIVWNGNTLTFQLRLDDAVSWDQEPEGAARERVPTSGEWDTWDFGDEYCVAGQVRWIMTSAWDGPTGWAAFLRWARKGGNTFTFHPDKDGPGIAGCTLEAPLGRWEPDRELNGDRTFRLVISNRTTEFTGY